MKRKRKKSRLYLKGGGRGWYADFRDYADVGGNKEAMKPPGSRYSTHEEDEAVVLMATRLKELEDLRAGRVARLRGDVSLTEYAREHLEKKAVTRRASTVERDEQSLWIFAQWYQGRYGGEPMLRDVTVGVVEEFLASRAATGSALHTRMNDLHALGSLFDGAKHDGYVSGANPGRMSELPDRAKPPKPTPREAEWLEPGEGAALLDAAGEVDAAPAPRGIRFTHALLATFLLTGGRYGEVTGLTLGDVNLDGGWVQIRDNGWRNLKTLQSKRRVPLWPQLHQILTDHRHRYREGAGPQDLLFPSPNGGPLRDIRGSLKRALKLAGIEKRVTPHTFRHTYTAQRVQTVTQARLPDGEEIWVPVPLMQVARELGHRDTGLVERLYGHLQLQPDRSTVVEYRLIRVLQLPVAVGQGA